MTVKDKVKKFFGLDEHGNEVPDPIPVAVPIGNRAPESIDARIARILNHSLKADLEKRGLETFEEADDFDIEDDPIDPTTPWEKNYDLATAHAAHAGVVSEPTPDQRARAAAVKDKLHKKKKSAPSEQAELEDAIHQLDELEASQTPKK